MEQLAEAAPETEPGGPTPSLCEGSLAIDYYIKQGDRRPAIARTLKDENDAAVDIEGATVRFVMRSAKTGVVKIAAAAANNQVGTGGDGSKGKVSYSWQAGDTDTAGFFYAEWEVTFADATKQTFPNDGHEVIKITEELG